MEMLPQSRQPCGIECRHDILFAFSRSLLLRQFNMESQAQKNNGRKKHENAQKPAFYTILCVIFCGYKIQIFIRRVLR